MMEILPSFQVDIKVEEKQDPREGKEEERKKDDEIENKANKTRQKLY